MLTLLSLLLILDTTALAPAFSARSIHTALVMMLLGPPTNMPIRPSSMRIVCT